MNVWALQPPGAAQLIVLGEDHEHRPFGDHDYPWHIHQYEDPRPIEELAECPVCGATSGNPCLFEGGEPLYTRCLSRTCWHLEERVPACHMKRHDALYAGMDVWYPAGGGRTGETPNPQRTEDWLNLCSKPEFGPGTFGGMLILLELPDGVDPKDPRVVAVRERYRSRV